MTLGIAKHRHRLLKLIGALLFSLLVASAAITTRFTSSEDGKPWWRVTIDHIMQDKDIVEKVKEAWTAICNLYKKIHLPPVRPPP